MMTDTRHRVIDRFIPSHSGPFRCLVTPSLRALVVSVRGASQSVSNSSVSVSALAVIVRGMSQSVSNSCISVRALVVSVRALVQKTEALTDDSIAMLTYGRSVIRGFYDL